MSNCVGNIAGNIEMNCEHPLEGGYTGRGVYIPMEVKPTLTRDASNKRIVTAITIDEPNINKIVAIDNEGVSPFDGSATTGNNDAGYTRFVKTVNLSIPQRGAAFAKDVLEPLVKSGRGGILVLEKVDQVGDGSFEIIGAQSPAKVVDPSTVTRTESATAGAAWKATMQSTEAFAEVVLFDTDYETTLEKFETLLANTY